MLEMTGSAFMVALVGFFLMSPLLALGLVGGVVADSRHRLAVNRALQAVNLVAVSALTAALMLDVAAAWHAYPVALATGTAWAFDQPFRRRAVRDLLGPAGVTNGLALEAVAMTGSRLIGPAVGGLLIASIGVRSGYPVVLGLAAAAFLLILLIRIPPPFPLDGSGHSAGRLRRLTSIFDGLGYVASNRLLLGTVAITFAVNLFVFPYMQVILVIARDVLEVESGLGLLLAGEGLGALAGALVIATFSGRTGRFGVIYVAGSMVAAGALLLLSFQSTYLGALLSLVLLGLGLSGFSTMQSAIVVVNTEDGFRGKALGVVTLAIGAGPLGALLVGGLASTLGPSVAIRIDAVAALATVAALWLLVPELRSRMGVRDGGRPGRGRVDPPTRTPV